MHLKDSVDVWFDSYLAHNRGNITWSMFCFEVCRRFGNIRPLDIVDEFNKIQQLGTMEHYQRKFEELASYMIIVNPMLNEAHFVASFVSGLKPELKPLVRLSNPVTLLDAYEAARLYEESFQALNRLSAHNRPSTSTNRPYNPNQITYQRTLAINPAPPTQNTPLRITYPTQRQPAQAPFKPNNMAKLREHGLCYK